MGILALAACIGSLAPTLGQAQAQAPDPHALGIAEVMLDYCAKAYPSSAEKHQSQVKRLTEGVSAEALAKVRNSELYRRAHDAEGDFVSKIDPRNAKRACSKIPVAGK
jgi:imidazolonepropionase-like amidohydrolase